MIRTINGLSLAKARVQVIKMNQWVQKIDRNCRKTLSRIGNIVALAPGWNKPNKSNTLKLVYIGNDAISDLKRLQKVFGHLRTDGDVNAEVVMGRMAVQIKIKNLPVVSAAPLAKAA